MIDKKHLDDYEIIVQNDEFGHEKKSVVYHGDLFEVIFLKGNAGRYREISLLSLSIILILHLSAGFINNPGMREFYIAIPYVLAYLPLYFLASGVFNLSKQQQTYRRNEVNLSYNRIKSASLFLACIISASLMGSIFFLLFFNTQDNRSMEHIFLSLELPATFFSGLIYSLQKNLNIIKIEKCNETQIINHQTIDTLK